MNSNQETKTIIISGANTGLGYETALALAKDGHHIIMACRNSKKADIALQRITKTVPKANIETSQLDLGDFSSVRKFAEDFRKREKRLDVLINNAGIMMPPFELTKDGHESQFGVNHLGHFLLTGLLLEPLLASPNSRVVSLSSTAHKFGKIKFSDLNSSKGYSATMAYCQSKLACLLFSQELQRRLQKASASTISVAAHPGVSDTELGRHLSPRLHRFLEKTIVPYLTHSPFEAAKPTIMAATGKSVTGGEYFGPGGFWELKGPAQKVSPGKNATNPTISAQLWEASEKLTGLSYL